MLICPLYRTPILIMSSAFVKKATLKRVITETKEIGLLCCKQKKQVLEGFTQAPNSPSVERFQRRNLLYHCFHLFTFISSFFLMNMSLTSTLLVSRR
jgi:hypothetical protein